MAKKTRVLRNKRKRREQRASLKHGPNAKRKHTRSSGRTGSIHIKKLQSQKDSEKILNNRKLAILIIDKESMVWKLSETKYNAFLYDWTHENNPQIADYGKLVGKMKIDLRSDASFEFLE